MLLLLTGVLESGVNRGARVPANPRFAIRMTQTESVTARLQALDAGGAPLPLQTIASTLLLTVRKQPEGAPIFPARLGNIRPELGLGIVDFQLVPADTRPELVPAGQYVYDVWLTQTDGARDPIVPTSPFILEPTVNRPTDPISLVPPVPLAPITPDSHEALRQLIHFVSSGPARGFASGAFEEILPAASPFPTSTTWWVSSAKTGKIVEKLVVRNPNQTPATITWNMYGADGMTVVESLTDTYTYSGVFVLNVTRAIT